MKKFILIVIITALIASGLYYWFFIRKQTSGPIVPENLDINDNNIFNPFNRGISTTPQKGSQASTSQPVVQEQPANPNVKLPVLRHISTGLVGGYMASTTASSTVVRYIDRGVGHVFESLSTSEVIEKISNTTIPRIYESYWNKNLNAAVLRYMRDETGEISNFYAEIRPTSATTTTPYEIKGKFLSPMIKEIAVSPKGDKIFTLNIEDGKGIGYISGFDESKRTKILESPLAQVNISWPEENTLAISTKASGVSSGYLYFIDVKKPVMKKILGGITGLSTKVSADAKKVIISSASSRGFTTSLYDVKNNSTQEVVFRTSADKCVWSKKYVDEVYCAVPTEIPAGIYPDDWYRGNVSFVDQIWHLDTTTGEVHLMASLLNLSDELIDATDLALGPREDYLYFINKRDLTLWSLDLTQ